MKAKPILDQTQWHEYYANPKKNDEAGKAPSEAKIREDNRKARALMFELFRSTAALCTLERISHPTERIGEKAKVGRKLTKAETAAVEKERKRFIKLFLQLRAGVEEYSHAIVIRLGFLNEVKNPAYSEIDAFRLDKDKFYSMFLDRPELQGISTEAIALDEGDTNGKCLEEFISALVESALPEHIKFHQVQIPYMLKAG